MTFRISALDYAPFAPLFDLTDDQLAAHQACRVIADAEPGFPCRVSLVDAKPGETLILTHYRHMTMASPFAASHAIYVRRNARRARPATAEIPQLLRSRLLSIRGFDDRGFMAGAAVTEGTDLDSALDDLFHNPRIAFIDIHFAGPGCFAARAMRA